MGSSSSRLGSHHYRTPTRPKHSRRLLSALVRDGAYSSHSSTLHLPPFIKGFSYVFSADLSQDDVFDKMVNPIVEDIMKGKSGMLAALGPSGSGKAPKILKLGKKGEPSGDLLVSYGLIGDLSVFPEEDNGSIIFTVTLELALAQAPSAALSMGHNGIYRNNANDRMEGSFNQWRERRHVKSLVVGTSILLALEDMDGGSSFLEKALQFLEKYGTKVEGILRQTADVEEVDQRVQEYEQGKVDFGEDEDAHVIGDCVKPPSEQQPIDATGTRKQPPSDATGASNSSP
ncbi:hypothetical protein AgCh_021507 [Apium graveolens]